MTGYASWDLRITRLLPMTRKDNWVDDNSWLKGGRRMTAELLDLSDNPDRR